MSKSVESITKALKLKADPKENALTFRVGVKKHTLPFEVRALVSGEFLFVHIPPSAGIMKITPDGLVPVSNTADATAAVASFRKSRKRGGARRARAASAGAEVPDAMRELLKSLPKGYKLVHAPGEEPRLVKSRTRKTTSSAATRAKAAPAPVVKKAPAKAAAKPAARKAGRPMGRPKSK